MSTDQVHTAPPDAMCIEPGCTSDPTTTRPITAAWLTLSGVVPEGVEWVCAAHGEETP